MNYNVSVLSIFVVLNEKIIPLPFKVFYHFKHFKGEIAMNKELKREYANIAFYAVILIIYLIVIINKANVTWWVPWAWIAISSI